MTSKALELEPRTHERIKELCAKGDEHAAAQRYKDALPLYKQAWELVPEPKNDWEASTWILAAIADACFFAGYRVSAREALEYAMTCPGGVGNPFLHLRLGQVLLDDGEKDAAANELMRAYMGAGDKIFATEDPKYFAFLNTRAKIS